MKIDPKIIEKAEFLIKDGNLVEFDKLIREKILFIDHGRVVDTIEHYIENGNTGSAIQFWRYIIEDHNDAKIVIIRVLKLILGAIWYIGAIGGWWFLVEKLIK